MKIGLRYIVFILLVTGLFAVQKLVVGSYFEIIPKYDQLINEAGRQRLFSQKFAKEIYLEGLREESSFDFDSLNSRNFNSWKKSFVNLTKKIKALKTDDKQLDSLLNSNFEVLNTFETKAAQKNRLELYDVI